MTRKLAFLILHTGKPYLRYAIQSILPQVDKLMIFYSPKPSQGHQTDMACPDTESDLLMEVLDLQTPDAKIQWNVGNWSNETDHVNAVQAFTDGFDWLVRLDADEIFPPGMVNEMIRQADKYPAVNDFRIPFVHGWRSFSKCCRDGSHPIRLTRIGQSATVGRLNGLKGTVTLDSQNGKWEVWHGGYAQPTKYIVYKQMVSGHKSEWRPDWFKDRWMANAQKDCHPVIHPTHWMAEDFDKSKMPTLMHQHPYFSMDLIE